MIMIDVDVIFTRSLLSQANKLVKQHFPTVDLRDAWVWRSGRQTFEFHGPNDFYWHGRAHNAYEARYHGWMAWLAHKGVNLEGGNDHD
jgi:hypothetical protein